MKQATLFRERQPDLSSYDVIIVNSSAGKDSQAMLDLVVEKADAAVVLVLRARQPERSSSRRATAPGTRRRVCRPGAAHRSSVPQRPEHGGHYRRRESVRRADDRRVAA